MTHNDLRDRYGNYDLIRVFSMIAVIMIHVSSSWISQFSKLLLEDTHALRNPLPAYVFNVISRFAVPCFLMLSGALLLSDERNENYVYFYRKSFRKTGIPTIIFSLLYIAYRFVLCFFGEKIGFESVLVLIKDVVIGAPMYHMWYVYMLIGIYALTPIIIRYKKSIAATTFQKISLCMLLLSCCTHWSSGDTVLHWDLGNSIKYLSYFLIGSTIHDNAISNTKKGISFILSGFFILSILGCGVYYLHIINRFIPGERVLSWISPFNPIIMLSCILIFQGISMLRFNTNCILNALSKQSFIVYLFHAGIWDVLSHGLRLLTGVENHLYNLNSMLWIPAFTAIVLALSFVASVIYSRIVTFFTAKKNLHPAKP